MTKKLLWGLAPLALSLLAAGCNKDGDDLQLTQSDTIKKAVSIVYPNDDTKEPKASMAVYKLNYDLVASTVGVSCSELSVNGVNTTFSTAALPMVAVGYEQKYVVNSVSVKGNVSMAGANSNKLSNLNLFLTNGVYDLHDPAPGVTDDYSSPTGLYMQYKLNDEYTVKTCQRDTYFAGKTVTTYPASDGSTQAYENEDIKYRVVLNLEKNNADVVLYDAKFAPPAPALKGLVLRGLTVKYENGGIQLEGENIIPEAFEGKFDATPNPRYVFNKFSLRTSKSDLTEVECEYTVATVFNGRFTGSAICFKR